MLGNQMTVSRLALLKTAWLDDNYVHEHNGVVKYGHRPTVAVFWL